MYYGLTAMVMPSGSVSLKPTQVQYPNNADITNVPFFYHDVSIRYSRHYLVMFRFIIMLHQMQPWLCSLKHDHPVNIVKNSQFVRSTQLFVSNSYLYVLMYVVWTGIYVKHVDMWILVRSSIHWLRRLTFNAFQVYLLNSVYF